MRAIDSLAPARLKLAPLPTRSLLPSQFTFYVAFPKSSIETRSLPTLARCFPRSFTFYVAFPKSSIETRSLPT
jgi:hypothetical protein